MKVWILGAGGLLGTTMYRCCVEENIECLATTKKEVDITNLESVRRFVDLYQPTHMVNCAAFTDVDRAEKEPEPAFQANVMGPQHLGMVAYRHGIRCIHVSTDYVFDGQKKEPYTETDSPQPLSIYAKSKWEGEQRLLQECPTACIIRSSWLFGIGGKNFISSLLTRLQTQKKLAIYSDQINRATFCKDFALAILDLLCHSGIFHFANRGELSRYQIANDMQRVAKEKKVPIICDDILLVDPPALSYQATRPLYSVLNTRKIEGILGRAPRTWKEVLEEFIDDIG